MVTPGSGLVSIRQQLVDLVAPIAVLHGAQLEWVAPEQPTIGADRVSCIPLFGLPRRRFFATDGGQPWIEQRGQFAVEWVWPKTAGYREIQAAIEATAAALRDQVFGDGLALTGDISISRLADRGARSVWQLSAAWERIAPEPSAGNVQTVGPITTTQNAVLAVRNIWQNRIEAAEGAWTGLRTFWDNLPTSVPILPFAAYWIDGSTVQAVETQAGTTEILGRALVQLHTSPLADAVVPTLQILERICAEHSREVGQVVLGPADLQAQTRTPVASLQTTIRLPFRFERAR